MSYYPTQQGAARATHVVVTPSRDRTGEVYNAKSSIGLGAVQIVIALLCFIFGAAVWPIQDERGGYHQTQGSWFFQYTSYVAGFSNSRLDTGASIWCGIFFLISGCLAVAAGRQRNTGLIVGAMVMSIISTVVGFSLMIQMALATTEEADNDYSNHSTGASIEDKVSLAIAAILLALSIVEIIVAIWTSVLYCATCCCDSGGYGQPTGNVGTTVVIQHQHHNQVMATTQPAYQPQATTQPPYQPQAMYPAAGPYQPQPSWAGGAAPGYPPQQQGWTTQPPSGSATYTTQQDGADVHLPAPPAYPAAVQQKY